MGWREEIFDRDIWEEIKGFNRRVWREIKLVIEWLWVKIGEKYWRK